ncbi:MAG: hypothetical protein M1812_007365 [Candelaria pacifica]|nr:MAG: hypothetical protein M1812_007365 [Candelaria pacifica]
MQLPAAKEVNFDIDKYLNRFIPRPRLYLLPRPVSWFLGYRDKPRKEIGNVLVWGWSFLGAFCGVALIEGVVKSSSLLQSYHPPLVLGSFGAAAILEYNTIESPLAQPRNSILGHLLSALVGVSTTKLFHLSPHFESLRWLAGAISCGLSSAIMGLTHTTHPPAGATALLAAIDPNVEVLGWFLIPLVLLSSLLMLGSALVINNLQRQFPLFWWTAARLDGFKQREREENGDGNGNADIEKLPKSVVDQSSSSSTRMTTTTAATTTKTTNEKHPIDESLPRIIITSQKTLVPEGVYLAGEERAILEILQDRLRGILDADEEGRLASGSSSVTRVCTLRD